MTRQDRSSFPVMKPALKKFNLALLAFTALAAVLLAEQQPQGVLGRIDFAELFDAVPALPASTVEAGGRAYGTGINSSSSSANLSPFYEPFNRRVAGARNVIKGAVDARPANQEALAQRTIAHANDSPLIAGMGGVEKISQMSEAEAQQAAAQAVGNYTQSHSGAPGGSPGMGAMMQRLMSDPAYQARFEKMTKKEQEAELQKYMGNAQAPTPPAAGTTAAEARAEHAVNENRLVVARQNEVGAILQQIVGIDAEFAKKEQAIRTGAGSHEQIAQQTNARIAKIETAISAYGTPEVIAQLSKAKTAKTPLAEGGEPMSDPAKWRAALQREQATLDRSRAALELQQRTALYAERKAKYTEVAASYAAWLKQYRRPVNDATAKLLNDATANTALHCEEELIKLAENLRKYHEDTTWDAAQYEHAYQVRMSER